VLSIGKLAAGQAKYYLNQAEARVDVVASVGDGIEDYYVGGLEARGEWLGRAAVELGLVGPVDGNALRPLLAGFDPRRAVELRDSSGRVRVAGFDLTFSAPKSVSVAFGLGGSDVRDAMRRAHDRAVVEAVGYVERSAAAVRRGHGGCRVEGATGVVAAAFRHRTSRVGDPQLHTHVLIANLGRGSDGRWSALDGRQLYAHARVASFVYQAVLRGELTRELGVEWMPVRQGIAELVGVPADVMREFSRRRAEIEAALAERGTAGNRAAEAAALATRRRKDGSVTVRQLVPEWRSRAEQLGFGIEEIGRLIGRARAVPAGPDALAAARDRLGRECLLTRTKATFTRRDVLLALCELLPVGAAVSVADLEAAADRFLGSERVVPLLPERGADDVAEAFRRRDGARLPVAGERRYSTPDVLALEQRVVDRVATTLDAHVGLARAADVDAAIAARPELAVEQVAMVRELCLGGRGVSVVVGKAGTGKTFALAAAYDAWEAAGLPVLGAAVARRAARELQSGAGIPSTSVAARLAGRPLPTQAILVVDEAGMVGTRQLAGLVELVGRADGKLVLVGDHRQLPELEAGGVFRGLVRRGFAIELRENRRQSQRWECEALDELRDGSADAAIALYRAHGRLVVARSSEAARERLVSDWWSRHDPDGCLMIARRRVDVADLNAQARVLMRRAGALGDEELAFTGARFAVGDRVVVKANDAGGEISNGDRGRVIAVDPMRRRLQLEVDGRHVELEPRFLTMPTARGDPALVHGYAVTGHIAQGATVRRSFVLADDGAGREWVYTAMSRGREANRMYLAAGDESAREEYAPAGERSRGALERLGASLQRSEAQSAATDLGGELPSAAARRHLQAVARVERLEQGWRRFLPRARGKLEAARWAEVNAREQVVLEGRNAATATHDQDPARLREELVRAAERRLARQRRGDRDFGIER
jgi:conjugative relaxase-like TrwC/TraI family protein